jgi:hypothetical protein
MEYYINVIPGTKIRVSERVAGVLLISGTPCPIFTLERGKIVSVVKECLDSGVVEVETNGLRLLFSRDSLLHHGDPVPAR